MSDQPPHLRARCPQCGESAEVPKTAVGRRAQCNRCRAVFVIGPPPQPKMPPPVSSSSAPGTTPIPLPRAQDPRPARSSVTLVAVAVAGAVGLALTLWVVVVLIRGARHAQSDARTPAVGTGPTPLSREDSALQAKREEAAFSNAMAAEGDTLLENYLREFPAGMHRDDARAELAARHERAPISAIIQSAIADDAESNESDALIQQGPAALAPLRKALTDPSLTATPAKLCNWRCVGLKVRSTLKPLRAEHHPLKRFGQPGIRVPSA